MSEESEDWANSNNFAPAWSTKNAFALIKTALHQLFMMREDFNPENPYEQLINTLTVTGMINSAFELNKNIEVRYGWEILDDDNLVMHSCFGTVDKVGIRLSGKEVGFLLNMGDEEFAAFAYKDIYWISEVE